MKCNSATDREILLKLSEASQCGVKIFLIVRGICCIVPGVGGRTDNISVISIVGRFLEHSRIYCSGIGDDKEVFISSADIMTRNTERRVEIACPVLDKTLRDRVCQILDLCLLDNVKSREQFPDGKYARRVPTADLRVNAQEQLMDFAAQTESADNDDSAAAIRADIEKLLPADNAAQRLAEIACRVPAPSMQPSESIAQASEAKSKTPLRPPLTKDKLSAYLNSTQSAMRNAQ
jgi:hypothetical protein